MCIEKGDHSKQLNSLFDQRQQNKDDEFISILF